MSTREKPSFPENSKKDWDFSETWPKFKTEKEADEYFEAFGDHLIEFFKDLEEREQAGEVIFESLKPVEKDSSRWICGTPWLLPSSKDSD